MVTKAEPNLQPQGDLAFSNPVVYVTGIVLFTKSPCGKTGYQKE